MKIPRYKWQPTTAEIAARAGIGVADVIRFDHNTSPFATDWAANAIRSLTPNLNEYPGADYRAVRAAAAKFTGVDPDRIVPGAGADELILLAARAFLQPGDTALLVAPTYPLYEIATRQVGAGLSPVVATAPTFDFPADAVIGAAPDAALVWLCAPNNPTGNLIDDATVDAVIDATDGIVVVDAAYAEFAGGTWSDRVERHDNLVVLRTLSKAFGIAGARVGYAMAHPDLIDAIDGIRPPGSISSLSVALGVATLENPARMRENVATLVAARAALAERLRRLDLRVLPSATNFLLSEVGPAAHRVATDLMAEGLVVRKFPQGSPLEEYLRFTVRSPVAHDRLISSLERHLP